jgi:hypothetical protein
VTFGFSFPSLVGNQELEEEEARTYTIGGVLMSPVKSPWLSQLRLTVDYYHVKLNNGISQQSIDAVRRRCFSTAYNPTLTLNEFCALIARDPATGAESDVKVTFSNGGTVVTSGVDTQFDWGVNLRDAGIGLPGRFGVNVLVNYLLEFKTTTDAGIIPLLDYAGTDGGGAVGTNGGAYRWKSFTTFNYGTQDATLSLSWRHLPAVRSQATVQTPTSTQFGAPAYDMFDLAGTIAVTRDVTFRWGVDNFLDIKTPLTNYNPGAVLPTLRGGTVNPGYYDILGRRFYVGARVRF